MFDENSLNEFKKIKESIKPLQESALLICEYQNSIQEVVQKILDKNDFENIHNSLKGVFKYESDEYNNLKNTIADINKDFSILQDDIKDSVSSIQSAIATIENNIKKC